MPMPPEMPPAPAGDMSAGLPPMLPDISPPPSGGGNAAEAIDAALAGGASTGEEIVMALETQGFIVEGGGAPMPGEMPLPEEMPMEEPMPEEMDLLGAARAGMAEGDNLKEQRRAEAGY